MSRKSGNKLVWIIVCICVKAAAKYDARVCVIYRISPDSPVRGGVIINLHRAQYRSWYS